MATPAPPKRESAPAELEPPRASEPAAAPVGLAFLTNADAFATRFVLAQVLGPPRSRRGLRPGGRSGR